MAHAHCKLDNYGYGHIVRKCNTYCFSMVKIVSLARLSVTLYVLYLPCYNTNLAAMIVTCLGAEVSVRCMTWKAYKVNVTLSQNSIP